jgi:alkanesulfonate monooxygenase SsuD/methylene tetrahydromethanopterin reductase-like flavin-dependent oxidoreductase (luciferase family)
MKREERSARLDEGVRLVRRLWDEEQVTFEGKFTQVRDMTLSPKPVQKPMPLWIGARAEKATRRVARLGCHLMATIGPDPAPWYMDELKKNGHDPKDFNIAQLRLVYLAETEDQAWEDTAEHIHSMMEFTGIFLPRPMMLPVTKMSGSLRMPRRFATLLLAGR